MRPKKKTSVSFNVCFNLIEKGHFFSLSHFYRHTFTLANSLVLCAALFLPLGLNKHFFPRYSRCYLGYAEKNLFIFLAHTYQQGKVKRLKMNTVCIQILRNELFRKTWWRSTLKKSDVYSRHAANSN